ncbi:MAG: aldo/keto reductase [Dehalococcoidales bacterium]|nr:aldo/keto reductase [Dehalococcoidales bacterium]
MEKRRLGKTGNMSSVLAFGGAAVGHLTQYEAESAVEMAVENGINHFDIAPVYGESEKLIGHWMKHNRKYIFLGCKTMERTKEGCAESIKHSLDRLQVDSFDLFQFHGVSDMKNLDMICVKGGALEAVLDAQKQGMTKYIGITGHCPPVQVEALNRFPFDTVLFPLNRVLASLDNEYSDFKPLMEKTRKEDVGTICIKAVARQPWGKEKHRYSTWYEPFDIQEEIDKSVWYTLSQGITTMPMASDVSLWPMIISAAERYHEMDAEEQASVMAEVKQNDSIFPVTMS